MLQCFFIQSWCSACAICLPRWALPPPKWHVRPQHQKIPYVTVCYCTLLYGDSTYQLIDNNCKKHCVTHVPRINMFEVMHRTIAVHVLPRLVPSHPKTLAVRGPKHLGHNHHCHNGSNWDSMATLHTLYRKKMEKEWKRTEQKAHKSPSQVTKESYQVRRSTCPQTIHELNSIHAHYKNMCWYVPCKKQGMLSQLRAKAWSRFAACLGVMSLSLGML